MAYPPQQLQRFRFAVVGEGLTFQQVAARSDILNSLELKSYLLANR
jgi:hypothetical protein